jgi:hypothetical protein
MTSRDLDVQGADNSHDSQDHLATMLAEMDNRLEMLQQELESLVPRTRTSQPQRAALVAAADPPAAAPAPRQPDPAADLPAGLRKRATRQITAVARGRSAPGAIQDAAQHSREPALRSITPDTIVRQTILQADEEARRVVQDARDCIAAIAARTRAQLVRSVSAPDGAQSSSLRRAGTAASTAPERREYEGTVTVQAGPFGDIVRLNEFEAALKSVPGVEDVYIRTFERHHAHFRLRMVEPRPLIGDLQVRVPGRLHVIEAHDSSICLEIAVVEDETDRGTR